MTEMTETPTPAEDQRLGYWWLRLLMTALDAIDPRTALSSLTSGDAYELSRR